MTDFPTHLIHNEPDKDDLITSQVILCVILIIVSFLTGLAVGGFYF